MSFFTKSISQGKEVINGCQDSRTTTAVLFNKEKESIPLLYGPYEESLVRFLADPKHPATLSGTELLEQATEYTRLTMHLKENNLVAHINMVRDFAQAVHAGQIILFCQTAALENYTYAVNIDHSAQTIELPANLIQEDIYRNQYKLINPYIIRNTEKRKILRIPFQSWPHVRNALKWYSHKNNRFSEFVLTQTDLAFRKKETTVSLPYLLDRFSNQISLLDLLLNGAAGIKQLLHTNIPLTIQAKSEEEKKMLELYLSDITKQRNDLPAITITCNPLIEDQRTIIELEPNNTIATYLLSTIRSLALLSEAFAIHQENKQPVEISFYNANTCQNNKLYTLSAPANKSTLQDQPEPTNLYAMVPASWRSEFTVQNEQDLRHVVSKMFHALYHDFFHQFKNHIIFTNDNQTAEMFFSNRYFRNEADYYRHIRGTIKLGDHARLLLDCDFSIALPHAEQGGQLIIEDHASGTFVPEFPGSPNRFAIEGNTKVIINKGSACRIVFGPNSQLIFDHSQPSVADFETDMESGTQFTFSRETGEHTEVNLASHYLLPGKTYHDIPAAKSFIETLKLLSKMDRPIIAIDDNEEMRKTLIPEYLEQTNSENAVALYTFDSTESFLQADPKLIKTPGIIIIDEDMGPEKMTGMQSLGMLHELYPQTEFILFAKKTHITSSINDFSDAFTSLQEEVPNSQFIDKPEGTELNPGYPLQKAVIEAIEKLRFGSH